MTPAEQVVRTLYDRVAAQDFDAATALLAEDAEFIQADSLPFGGRYVGRTGFARMAQGITAAWPGFAVRPVGFMNDGGDVVVVSTRLSGRGLDMQMLELWTVRDGRVRRCQPFYFDTAAAAGAALENLQ